MASFQGFVRGTRYTPLPNDLFGALLEEIDTLAELKCTLRVLALVYQRRTGPAAGGWVSLPELLADRVLQGALGREEGGGQEAIRQGVARAVARGTLLQVRAHDGDGTPLLLVNDERGRRALQQAPGLSVPKPSLEPVPADGGSGSEKAGGNIFVLYEENLGPVTPLLAEELKEAETAYPWSWIQEAFREAVTHNHRSWRYVARILERWAAEGKRDGEPSRYSKTADPKEYLRRYGRFSRS